MKEARIIYNKKDNAFELQINIDNKWEKSKSYKCIKSEKRSEIGKVYITWRILADLEELAANGYKITFNI